MARVKQDLARTEELADDFIPGLNVVVRSKGYPAWPAVIVDESDVPEAVKAVKPSKKVVVPVCFYNDNSFLWISPDEIQELSKEQAIKYSQAKIKKILKEAYAMAAEAPSSYPEIMAKLQGQTADDNASNVSSKAEEPPAPVSRRARSAAERAAEQLPAKARATTAKKRGALEASTTAPSKKSRVSNKSNSVATDGDDDDSEYVDQGTTESTEDSTSIDSDASNQANLANSQAARYELCSSIRGILQKSLLVTELSESAVEHVKDALSQLKDPLQMEIAVIRKSKLNRVIFAALSNPILPSQLRQPLSELYETWSLKLEPVIRGIPEDLAPREETEEPEDYDRSVEVSREPTAEPQEESQEEPKSKTQSPENNENVKEEVTKSEEVERQTYPVKTDVEESGSAEPKDNFQQENSSGA